VNGVVQLLGTASDAAAVYLLFDPCPGGDLYKRLARRGLLTEAQLVREVRAVPAVAVFGNGGIRYLQHG
jgi:hypothetical protein